MCALKARKISARVRWMGRRGNKAKNLNVHSQNCGGAECKVIFINFWLQIKMYHIYTGRQRWAIKWYWAYNWFTQATVAVFSLFNLIIAFNIKKREVSSFCGKLSIFIHTEMPVSEPLHPLPPECNWNSIKFNFGHSTIAFLIAINQTTVTWLKSILNENIHSLCGSLTAQLAIVRDCNVILKMVLLQLLIFFWWLFDTVCFTTKQKLFLIVFAVFFELGWSMDNLIKASFHFNRIRRIILRGRVRGSIDA